MAEVHGRVQAQPAAGEQVEQFVQHHERQLPEQQGQLDDQQVVGEEHVAAGRDEPRVGDAHRDGGGDERAVADPGGR